LIQTIGVEGLDFGDQHSDYVTNIVCESQVVRKSKGDKNERTSNKESTTL